MEIDEDQDTPPKVKSTAIFASMQNSSGGASSIGSCLATPSGGGKKKLHPRTPNSSSFNMCGVVITPPAKRFNRVRNPFDSALTDRLHLPLIGSPSLFKRAAPPQLSSTQFEWTIDEVSSLKPANLEPHETQFHDSPNPDIEAKAQSAISSYFKDQQIVPSPVDCPLRSQRIILSELNGNTPISKPGRRIRDCSTQTELSFPVVLPAALEEALRPYFQPQLAEKDIKEILFESRLLRSSTDTDIKDVSLRRKLFDMHNIIVLDTETKTPTVRKRPQMGFATTAGHSNSSPLSLTALHQQTAIAGKLSDSLDGSSFGSLSPISAKDGISISPQSPYSSFTKRKPRLHDCLYDSEGDDPISPIHPPNFKKRNRIKNFSESDKYRCDANLNGQTFGDLSAIGGTENEETTSNANNFTPDHSSSPLQPTAEASIGNSINVRVSRLQVNSAKANFTTKYSSAAVTHDVALFTAAHDDTDDMLDDEDDEMQVSQLSACNSSNSSDTPRSKRRSASRKNLSQSFNANWLEKEEANEDEAEQMALAQMPSKIFTSQIKEFLSNEPQSATTLPIEKSSKHSPTSKPHGPSFYRTDSGFNEMTTSTSSCDAAAMASKIASTYSVQGEMDASMTCSTPSKKADTALRSIAEYNLLID